MTFTTGVSTTDKPMDAQEAVEVLKRLANAALLTFTPDAGREIAAALTALDGMNIYASPFKPGDDVWFLVRDHRDRWVVLESGFCACMDGYGLFADEAAAEAEARRRNKSIRGAR